MTEVVVTTETIGGAKLESNHHHQQTNTEFWPDALPVPNRQRQSGEGIISHTFHGAAARSSPVVF